MICQPCRTAADQHLGPEHHCRATGGPGARCDCQHDTSRYRTRPAATLELVDGLIATHRRAQDEALAVDTWRQLINGPRTVTTKD